VVCLHDQTKFHTSLFATSNTAFNGPRSPTRLGISQCASSFVDVTQEDFSRTATTICQAQIHILLDLNGYSTGARSEVFVHRPALVQLSGIGYPDTLGADWVPYLLSDSITSPPSLRGYYTERFVLLPFTFHSSAYSLRSPACEEEPTTFHFASFSQAYKVGPEVFSTWANVLRRSTGRARLRFARWPQEVGDALGDQTAAHGLGKDTLDLVDRIRVVKHLDRVCSSDLVFDTPVLNGGTTVMDALSASAPVLTTPRQRMPSRVAVGLVLAVTPSALMLTPSTLKEYEDSAMLLL